MADVLYQDASYPQPDGFGDEYLTSPPIYDDGHSHFEMYPNPNLRSYADGQLPMMQAEGMYADQQYSANGNGRGTISPQHLFDDGDNSGDYMDGSGEYRPNNRGGRQYRTSAAQGHTKYLNLSSEVVRKQRADARRARNRLYAKECRARKKEMLGTLDQQLAIAQNEIVRLREEIANWKQIAQNRGTRFDPVVTNVVPSNDNEDEPIASRTRRSSMASSAFNSRNGSSLALSPASNRSRRSSRRSDF